MSASPLDGRAPPSPDPSRRPTHSTPSRLGLRLLPGAAVLAALPLLAGVDISYYEEALPSTLNPLFGRTMVDKRSSELVFDRLFYRSPITNDIKSRLVMSYERIGDGKEFKIVL